MVIDGHPPATGQIRTVWIPEELPGSAV